jgi:hypothetical protein
VSTKVGRVLVRAQGGDDRGQSEIWPQGRALGTWCSEPGG